MHARKLWQNTSTYVWILDRMPVFFFYFFLYACVCVCPTLSLLLFNPLPSTSPVCQSKVGISRLLTIQFQLKELWCDYKTIIDSYWCATMFLIHVYLFPHCDYLLFQKKRPIFVMIPINLIAKRTNKKITQIGTAGSELFDIKSLFLPHECTTQTSNKSPCFRQ